VATEGYPFFSCNMHDLPYIYPRRFGFGSEFSPELIFSWIWVLGLGALTSDLNPTHSIPSYNDR
jgi:hypothetical protein